MNCLPDHGEPGQDAGEHAVRHGILASAEEGTAALLQLPLEGVQSRVKGNLLGDKLIGSVSAHAVISV